MSDQAFLYVADEMDYAAIVATLDAIAATTRDALVDGKTVRVPAFRLIFAVSDLRTGSR